MAENNILSPVTSEENLKGAIRSADVKKKFADVLGDEQKASQFLANVVTTVANNTLLRTCSTNDILGCAFTAAALNLDVIPGLGFAAIVPYKKNSFNEQTKKWVSRTYPQFQIMTKGFIQLALRSEQVTGINITDVYADELESYNRLTGEITVKDVPGGQRDQGLTDRIVGYACWVRLRNGFEKTVYWTVADINKHAQQYSQAYQNDLKSGKATSPWSTNFPAMAKKTVVKATISNWVPMSTQMRFAQMADQSTSQNVTVGPDGKLDGQFSYADNEIPEVPEEPTPEAPKSKAESFKEKHNIGKAAEQEQAPQPETEAAGPEAFNDDIPWPEDDEQKEMF